jgi:hypothetical protein
MGPENVMYWHIRLTAFLMMLVLFGCAQSHTRYPLYSPENSGNMPERDNGDGGGGSGSM